MAAEKLTLEPVKCEILLGLMQTRVSNRNPSRNLFKDYHLSSLLVQLTYMAIFASGRCKLSKLLLNL